MRPRTSIRCNLIEFPIRSVKLVPCAMEEMEIKDPVVVAAVAVCETWRIFSSTLMSLRISLRPLAVRLAKDQASPKYLPTESL